MVTVNWLQSVLVLWHENITINTWESYDLSFQVQSNQLQAVKSVFVQDWKKVTIANVRLNYKHA